MLSSNKRCIPVMCSAIKSHNFSVNSPCLKSHYDSLGVTPSATQTDIKAAYYKLSMKYHPDKNKGSESASDKFRDITSAYEVLGNFKLRKLYDKGILHTAGDKYSYAEEPVVDDPTTKFYKSRMQRTKPPTPTGKTPIYDFDEWSRSHYGATFARREAAHEKFKKKASGATATTSDIQKEYVIFGVITSILVFSMLNYSLQPNYDIVETTPKLNGKSSIDQPNRDT